MGVSQNRAADWALGSNGCYDAASLARLQMTLKFDFESVAVGNVNDCLTQPIRADVLDALKAETMRADPTALGNIMADHTQVGFWCRQGWYSIQDILGATTFWVKCRVACCQICTIRGGAGGRGGGRSIASCDANLARCVGRIVG